MVLQVKVLTFTAMLLAGFPLAEAKAQEKQAITERDYQNQSVEMADLMRSNGKIYIVVATVVSLLVIFLFYLVSVERKVARLEKLAEKLDHTQKATS